MLISHLRPAIEVKPIEPDPIDYLVYQYILRIFAPHGLTDAEMKTAARRRPPSLAVNHLIYTYLV